MNKTIEKIVSLCKQRGFVYQSSEIYGGFGAVYDYGPLGVELKNNIANLSIIAQTTIIMKNLEKANGFSSIIISL